MTDICCVNLDIITPHLIKRLNVHDRDNQFLAETIPSLIVRARQPNTCSSYTTYLTKWKEIYVSINFG